MPCISFMPGFWSSYKIRNEVTMALKRKSLNKEDFTKEGIDDRLIDKVQTLRRGWLDKLMIVITKSGNGGMIWIFIALYLYIFAKLHSKAIVLICVIACCAFINNFIIKGIFTKDRPCDLDDSIPLLIKRPLGSSFPSGHTASSFASVVVIFYINPWLGVIALIWAALIGFSRVYLYVHFPSDVFFGIISGTAIAFVIMPIAIHFIGW